MGFQNVLKWAGLTALLALIGRLEGVDAAGKSVPVYKVGTTVDLKKIAVKDLDGKALNWDQYKDKILVVNYFATW